MDQVRHYIVVGQVQPDELDHVSDVANVVTGRDVARRRNYYGLVVCCKGPGGEGGGGELRRGERGEGRGRGLRGSAISSRDKERRARGRRRREKRR